MPLSQQECAWWNKAWLINSVPPRYESTSNIVQQSSSKQNCQTKNYTCHIVPQ